MNLSEFYIIKIKQVRKVRNTALKELNPQIRNNCNQQVWDLETDCSAISHALSMFGNISKSEALKLTLRPSVKNMRLHGYNPWLIGLNLFLCS